MRKYNIPIIAIATAALLISACRSQPSDDPGVVAREIYRMNRERILNAVRMNFRAHHYSGLPSGEIKEIHIFDLDHTLVDTRTQIPYRSTGASENESFSDSKCMVFGPDEKADYSVFTRVSLLDSQPVADGMEELRKAAGSGAPVFIVTSRGGKHNFASIPEYLAREGIKVDGVFPVNSRFFGRHLWRDMHNPASIAGRPAGVKKPILIAALIDLARRQGAWPRRVVYHDDTDKHFRGSMVLLGLMFPEIQFELIDYIRTAVGNDFTYTRRPAARSREGRWYTFNGAPIADGREYDSGDCPDQKPYPPVIFR